MAFQPVPHTVTLILRFQSTDGSRAQNDLNFEYPGVPTEEDLNDLLGAASTAFTSNLATQISRDWSLYELECRSEDAAAPIKAILRPNPAAQGLLAQDGCPANSTFAVKLGIGTRGRGASGRLFFVGLGQDNVDVGYLTEAYAAVIVQEVRDFCFYIANDQGATHVVVHRYEGNPPVRLAAGIPRAVTSYSYTDLAVDSQKLRLPNHRKRKARTTP